jgi:beta-lactamase superfamily II metal-dependent hydrolase
VLWPGLAGPPHLLQQLLAGLDLLLASQEDEDVAGGLQA